MFSSKTRKKLEPKVKRIIIQRKILCSIFKILKHMLFGVTIPKYGFAFGSRRSVFFGQIFVTW
jgi:hypothetical protein